MDSKKIVIGFVLVFMTMLLPACDDPDDEPDDHYAVINTEVVNSFIV